MHTNMDRACFCLPSIHHACFCLQSIHRARSCLQSIHTDGFRLRSTSFRQAAGAECQYAWRGEKDRVRRRRVETWRRSVEAWRRSAPGKELGGESNGAGHQGMPAVGNGGRSGGEALDAPDAANGVVAAAAAASAVGRAPRAQLPSRSRSLELLHEVAEDDEADGDATHGGACDAPADAADGANAADANAAADTDADTLGAECAMGDASLSSPGSLLALLGSERPPTRAELARLHYETSVRGRREVEQAGLQAAAIAATTSSAVVGSGGGRSSSGGAGVWGLRSRARNEFLSPGGALEDAVLSDPRLCVAEDSPVGDAVTRGRSASVVVSSHSPRGVGAANSPRGQPSNPYALTAAKLATHNRKDYKQAAQSLEGGGAGTFERMIRQSLGAVAAPQ